MNNRNIRLTFLEEIEFMRSIGVIVDHEYNKGLGNVCVICGEYHEGHFWA